jgi:hypothetical protein
MPEYHEETIMAVSEQLKTLVDQMPPADGRGMYTDNIDKGKIEKAVREIAKGGKASVEGLIEMLGEPGTVDNVKPHYALHCVVNSTLVSRDEKLQREICAVMADALSNSITNYNKAYLCQELQWAGSTDNVAALATLLTSEELCDPAGMALVAIKDGAADALKKELPGAKGRCRLVIIHSLAALADAGSAAIFKEALGDDDREVRLAGGSGISKIGDASAVDALLKAADVAPGWERIQQTKHCLVLAEQLAATGKKSDADKIYRRLKDSRKDATETYIREIAAAAL